MIPLSNQEQPDGFRKGNRIVIPEGDPTKTLTLRNRFDAQVSARYKNLMRAITESIVKNDCFGLRISNQEQPLPPESLAALTLTQQLEAFDAWLVAAINQGVLEVVPTTGEPWTNPFIENAYGRGVIKGNVQVRQLIGVPLVQPVDASNVFGVLGVPSVNASLELQQNRIWTALNGINDQMRTQVYSVLSDGLEAGFGPTQIAREINDRVSAIGMTRSRMVARTEIVRSHNLGSVAEHDRLSLFLDEDILSQWHATLDSRLRDSHRARHGKIFKSADARALLGEPNCRCGILPYIESVEGEATISEASSFLN